MFSNYALRLGKLEPLPNRIFFFFITLFHIMLHGDFIQFDSSIQFFVVVVFLLSKAMVCYLAVAGIFLEFK